MITSGVTLTKPNYAGQTMPTTISTACPSTTSQGAAWSRLLALHFSDQIARGCVVPEVPGKIKTTPYDAERKEEWIIGVAGAWLKVDEESASPS